jgi:ATP-dependent RNA helicase DeaD
VELPAKLSRETLKALEKTRISGVLINLQPERGRDNTRRRDGGAKRREHTG